MNSSVGLVKCRPEVILSIELAFFPQGWIHFLRSTSFSFFQLPIPSGSTICMAIGAPYRRIGPYIQHGSQINVWSCLNQVTRKLVYTCGVAVPG